MSGIIREKIAIVGDTHGRIEEIKQELKKLSVDHFLYTGDFYGDAKRLAHYLGISFDGVLGNCDPPNPEAQEERVIDWAGKRIFMVHGHQYGVKTSLNRLYYRAAELQANIVLFGHTHMPVAEFIEDILFINPGSPSRPRGGAKPSFALLEFNDNIVRYKIITL